MIHDFQMTKRTTASFYCTDFHMGRTWSQHAQLRVDMTSPYVLTGSCVLQNKMAASKQHIIGSSLSHIYKAEESMLPLNRPSQNMKFPMKFHNP